jgi:hypothetical protein
MCLKIHSRRYYIVRVLAPGIVETRVNAELLARHKIKFRVRGHVPGSVAPVLSLGLNAKVASYRHTVDTLYKSN